MLTKNEMISKINILKTEFRKNNQNSKKLFYESKKYIPGGVSSNLRFYSPFPLFFKNANGVRLNDLDGHNYIDYNLSYGVMILGHNHPYVQRKVKKTLEKYGSPNYGAPTELMVDFAKRIKSLYPSADKIRFCNTGTEATLNAIRFSRGFLKKPMIAKFEGHYHGSHDDVLVSTTPFSREGGTRLHPRAVSTSKGIPREMYKHTLILPFNDLEAAKKIIMKNRNKISCIIMEAVSKGYIPAEKDFVKGLRELTEKLGIILIFDEVLTGFRVGLKGAQYYYKVKPDLTCIGKIAGGGAPLSAVMGREDIMNVVSPLIRGNSHYVYHSGTYNGNILSVSYGLATLDILEKKRTYLRIMNSTDKLKEGFRQVFSDRGIELNLTGLGAMFNILFTSKTVKCHRDTIGCDKTKRELFDYTMLNNGIYLIPGRRFSLSLMHKKDDIQKTLDIADTVAKEISGE